MVRIGLIGAGWVSRHHLAAWASLSGRAQVVAVADPDLNRARSVAAEFGITSVYASASEMVEDCELDVVDITASRSAHVALVRLAAARGLDALCQKPLAPTLAEARMLLTETSGRIRLMVHENWRFRAYYREIASWLQKGEIGTVKAARMELLTSSFCADVSGRSHLLETQPYLKKERRLLVQEVLIHHLDTLRMLFGPLQVVSATLSRSCPEVIGEDTAMVHLKTTAGAAVGLFGTFVAKASPNKLLDEFVIVGTHGQITLSGSKLTLDGVSTAERTYDLDAEYRASYRHVIDHFLSRRETDLPFETSIQDNLETLALVEHVYRLSDAA